MDLEQDVIERLSEVIDPETGVDVMRMRLIEDLRVDRQTGRVAYRFRPSSPLCPLAVHLALGIRDAVAGVPGVTWQEVEVVGYVGAEALNAMLRDTMSDVAGHEAAPAGGEDRPGPRDGAAAGPRRPGAPAATGDESG